MTEVYLALGGNLGDRAANLHRAEQGLAAFVDIHARSGVLEAPAQYRAGQPDFLNMVLAGETALSAPDLLRRVKALERALGRVPSPRFGPRLIDIDILYYGDSIVDLPDLQIPHRRLQERYFVLRPLSEIAPDLRHPATGRSTVEMLAALPARVRQVAVTDCRG